MEIKITVSIAGADFSYSPGQIVDMPAARAKKWIKRGHAVAVNVKKLKEPKKGGGHKK